MSISALRNSFATLILFLLPLAVAGLPADPAFALSTSTAKGTIKALDSKACTVLLSDSYAYQFGKGCDFSKLTVGELVAIVWVPQGTVRSAVQVFVSR
jgi:hypothetical protein